MSHRNRAEFSTPQSAHLVEALIFSEVCKSIDFDKLADLQQRIAVELARLPDVTDAEMLAQARGAIARALRQVADDQETPKGPLDDDHDCRYLNALCAEFDPGPSSSSRSA